MNRCAAIILAAGASTRLGRPKQLVHLAGEPLLVRAVRIATAASCNPVVVVLGAAARTILAQCSLPGATVVLNHEWAEGIASSIRTGITVIADQVDAAILMTCDQPAVNCEHLRLLMDQGAEGIVASAYAGRRGVPACFPAHTFPKLMLLRGDAGARQLLEASDALELFGGELDIDTPESLRTARDVYSKTLPVPLA